MSNFTPPPSPLGYSTPLPGSNPRPTTVTVFAILAIIFGSLGILASMCAIPQWLGMRMIPNPVQDNLQKDPVIVSAMLVTLAVNLVLYVIELLGGIGSLSLKPSGRGWLIRYAVIHIIFTLVSVPASAVFLQPRNRAIIQSTLAQNPTLNTPQMAMVMRYSASGGYCFAIVFLIWPILILYFMNRPHVKAAFGEGDNLPPTQQPFA